MSPGSSAPPAPGASSSSTRPFAIIRIRQLRVVRRVLQDDGLEAEPGHHSAG
ncbi:MAG: hypothetical protein MZV63_60200 [Marinilabiliales bacterium]|nr:hypothetical protein [Marinilabiliales bacterium]